MKRVLYAYASGIEYLGFSERDEIYHIQMKNKLRMV